MRSLSSEEAMTVMSFARAMSTMGSFVARAVPQTDPPSHGRSCRRLSAPAGAFGPSAASPHSRSIHARIARTIRRSSLPCLLGQVECSVSLCSVRAPPGRLSRRPRPGRSVLEGVRSLRGGVGFVVTPRRLLRLLLRDTGLVPTRTMRPLLVASRLFSLRRHLDLRKRTQRKVGAVAGGGSAPDFCRHFEGCPQHVRGRAGLARPALTLPSNQR